MSEEEPMDFEPESSNHSPDSFIQSIPSEGHTSANVNSSAQFSRPLTSFCEETTVDSRWEGPAGFTGDQQLEGDQHLPDPNQAMPSAPFDETTVYVCVKVTEGSSSPSKLMLQKSLQSWFNKEFDKKGEVTINNLSVDGNWATVNISPSSDIEYLLKLQEIQVALKNSAETVIVQFHRNAPQSTPSNQSSTSQIRMTVKATVDISGYSHKVQSTLKTKFSRLCLHDHSLTITGSFHEVEQFHSEVTKVIEEAEAGRADTRQKEMLSVPLIQFSYMNQAYRKEIEQIEQINGVKVNAEVKVSIEKDPQKTSRDSQLTKANQEFIDLFQKCVGDFDNMSIPLSHVDPGDFMNTLKNIVNEKTKLVMNLSANGCEVFGQKQRLVAVRKAFGMSHASSDKTFGMEASGSSARPETPQTIGIDIKDPLLSHGLTMDEDHWDLMRSAFEERIIAIKRKCGVDFMIEISLGKVKVKTRPTKGVVSLEGNAIAAFMHLYQKVATSAMSCHLIDSTQAKIVKTTLEVVLPQNRCVWTGELNGPCKLVGLPEDLNPAVKEIEKSLGYFVFKAEDKQRIGYHEYVQLAPITQQPEHSGDGATGGPEEVNCPICMDPFTDKVMLTCKHGFCKDCLRKAVESIGSICPLCKDVFGMVEGDQPDGEMRHYLSHTSLPGFPGCGSITINYYIPDGIQTNKHPNPRKRFYGTRRTAYLPDNREGKEVLDLLKKAFNQRLIFTVGMSRTTGAEDTVTWNDIHHKTSIHGGPQLYTV